MINALIKWSLENRLVVVSLSLALFIFGSLSVKDTPVDVLPEFAPPQVVIQTEAPGLAAEEVEALVTIPLESALNGTSRVQVVRSSSFEGLSFITVIFEWGTDIYIARQLVTEKVQAVAPTFPPSIRTPILSPITSPIGAVSFFALTADKTPLMKVRSYADWEIRNGLLAVPGVAKVLTYGGEVKQYQVLVNPEKLKQYEISLNEVVNAADRSNVIVGGGYILKDDREFLIRGLGKIKEIDELKNSIVGQKDNVPIYMKDIAKVKIGPAFKRSDGSVDGKEAVIVAISKQPWVNTLELNENIKEKLAEIKRSLPKDIEIIKTYSQSDFINVSIKNIISSIWEGAILVIIILFVFLANWRTSVISLSSIPLALIIAILVFKSFGETINAMTLGGLAVAVGQIVDDAIIDVENIYKRLRENRARGNPKPDLEVIYLASCEIRHPVIYGTLIIAVVLLPVLFLTGLAGQIFRPLAWAYIIAVLASLAVAMTLTPAMSYYLLSKSNLPSEETKLISKLKNIYSNILNKLLNKSKAVLSVALILFAIAAFTFSSLGKSFLPELGEENLIVMAIAPPGSSLKYSHKLALGIEKTLLENPHIVRVGNRAGRSESDDEPITANITHFDITLKSGISEKEKEEVIEFVRSEFEKVPGIVTLIRSFITETIEQVTTGQRAPIVLKLYGSDLPTLRKKADEVTKTLKKIKTLKEIQIEPLVDIPQVHVEIKRDEAARYGLKVGDLLETIQYAFNGVGTKQRVIEGQRAFDLFVWFEEPYRDNLEIIKNTLIDTPIGIKVPLGQLSTVEEEKGPNIINREKVSRRIVIQANAKKADISKSVEKAIDLVAKEIKLQEGYRIEFEGDYKQQKEANQKLLFLSLIVLLSIYLLLSIAFKSFKVSAVVMANLPFALIGGVFAIAITSGLISLAAIIGFITLFGVSTRNCILLVNHYFDIQKNNPNLNIDEVIKQGSMDRLAPILMTALTTSFAMLPLAMFPGAGREIEHPLAIVIVGGMISATLLTLLVVPVMYKRFIR